jgi:hypothetical protein
MRNFIICTARQILKRTDQNEGDHKEELSADGGVILKEILKK